MTARWLREISWGSTVCTTRFRSVTLLLWAVPSQARSGWCRMLAPVRRKAGRPRVSGIGWRMARGRGPGMDFLASGRSVGGGLPRRDLDPWVRARRTSGGRNKGESGRVQSVVRMTDSPRSASLSEFERLLGKALLGLVGPSSAGEVGDRVLLLALVSEESKTKARLLLWIPSL